MTKIGVYIPTRGRPTELARCVESIFDTATDPDRVQVICYRDDDDTSYDDVDLPVTWITGPRVMLSKAWNICYSAGDADVVCHGGDDIVFRSEHWDSMVEAVVESVPDRIAFVYGRDGHQDDKLGTHGFITREWAEAVGYMVPPLFSHDYNDTWLNEVAARIGRRMYLPDLFMEHMHWIWGKAPHDQTYLDHEQAGAEDNVAALWESTSSLRVRDAARLMAVMS